MASRALAWLAPGGLVLLGAAAWVYTAPDPQALLRLAAGYEYAVYALALLLAWRFQRSRVAVAVMALALTTAVLPAWWAAGPIFQVAAFSLPVTLVLIAFLRDRGVLSPLGLAQQLLVLLQPVGLWAADRLWPGAIQGFLSRTVVPARFTGWTPLGQPAFIAALASVLLLGVLAAARHRPVELGLFWTAVAAVFALHAPTTSPFFSLYLATAGLILALSVVEHSYSLAYHDELTGLPARRALWKAVNGAGSRYTLALMDIDHFKKVNDRYGHDVGDQVLRMVGARLRRMAFGGQGFRYGGEEFALLYPGVSRDEVLPHLESLRATFAAETFTLRAANRPKQKPNGKKPPPPRKGRRSLRVTVSIGAAEPGWKAESAHAVLKAADKALYRAKRAGRNQVK